jgi:predicted dehydrogenase
MADGFDFNMSFTINCEEATIDYDFGRGNQPLKLYRGGNSEVVTCPAETGYVGELRYFAHCLRRQEKPAMVTAQDAVECLKVLEAEKESVASARPINLA